MVAYAGGLPAMVQSPQLPHVPIRYCVCGLFWLLAMLVELSNWVTFTYGHTRYVYSGRAKSNPQKQLPTSDCTAAGPYRTSVVHCGRREADTVAVTDGDGEVEGVGVPVLESVGARDEVAVAAPDLVLDEVLVLDLEDEVVGEVEADVEADDEPVGEGDNDKVTVLVTAVVPL